MITHGRHYPPESFARRVHGILLMVMLAFLCIQACALSDKSIADQFSNNSLRNGPTATQVYGQLGSLMTGTDNKGGLGANSLYQPTGIAADASGIYIADAGNHRVLFFSGGSTTATRVYGQNGSFSSSLANNGGISANSLNYPTGVTTDATGVYIADNGNSRVLYYPGTSTTATRVYGQLGGFSSGSQNNGGVSADSLKLITALTSGVAVDTAGVIITDTGNHRVLFYPGVSTTATRVYGQGGNYTTNTSPSVNVNSSFGPVGVAVDGTGVYIAEYFSNRVAYYSGTSTVASRVYGQLDSFTTNAANKSGINAGSLFQPMGIALGNGGLYVADNSNNRVLFYSGTSNTASQVYGQSGSFTSSTMNGGGISATSLASPIGIAVDSGGKVYIGEFTNHRALAY